MVQRRAFLIGAALAGTGTPVNRRELVRRHNPVLTDVDERSPVSVGNGEFAFTVDVTGLQSLPSLYGATLPLCTQSQWGWHSFPAPDGLGLADLRLENFDTYGRQVGYATRSVGQEKLFNWLRENPHRLNLARIGLLVDSRPIERGEIGEIRQTLDLWTGAIDSEFVLKGSPVHVRTVCHPGRDGIAVVIETPLRSLSVTIDFPYGSPGISGSDWNAAGRHASVLDTDTGIVSRTLDSDRYFVRLRPEGSARVEMRGPHRVAIEGGKLDFTCEFAGAAFANEPLSVAATQRAAAEHWNRFWSNGGAIDLSASTDKRAPELERRIVLSQYLTAIQCSGSAPPQETGLTCNSWFGKFHLEMHWWHAAHFPLWGRAALIERSLGWYVKVLPAAREKARQQGYTGARWPKMTALDGRSSPSAVGEMLIWQQPHPIAMAELCYRSHPGRATLERYREVVMQSAEFMASYAVERNGRYVLGPPVIPAQENHDPRKTWNPTFELAYWLEALGIAIEWRRRLGLPGVKKWEEVRRRLSALPVRDGVYLAHENCPDTFTAKNYDHPSMLAAYGVLNGEGVDRETMRRTLHRVIRDWRWRDSWGWDFPMTAMTAARLGEPELAIDALFMESPKNTWLASGHNWQRPGLPVYLPGNGGLLTAVAMMAAKWNGFPRSWSVRWEGIRPLLDMRKATSS